MSDASNPDASEIAGVAATAASKTKTSDYTSSKTPDKPPRAITPVSPMLNPVFDGVVSTFNAIFVCPPFQYVSFFAFLLSNFDCRALGFLL